MSFCEMKKQLLQAAKDLGIELTDRPAQRLTRLFLQINPVDLGVYAAQKDPTADGALRRIVRDWLREAALAE